MENLLIALFACLIVKHYLFDFQWQTPFMYLNKGKWGHAGGIAHSGSHALASFAALSLGLGFAAVPLTPFDLVPIGVICGVEFVVHYVTDLAKVQICDSRGWSKRGKDSFGNDALNIYSDKYFLALGLDQTVHLLTYAAMLWAFSKLVVN